jgi:hypothetical protein
MCAAPSWPGTRGRWSSSIAMQPEHTKPARSSLLPSPSPALFIIDESFGFDRGDGSQIQCGILSLGHDHENSARSPKRVTTHLDVIGLNTEQATCRSVGRHTFFEFLLLSRISARFSPTGTARFRDNLS